MANRLTVKTVAHPARARYRSALATLSRKGRGKTGDRFTLLS
jgi:hypothetical protein